MSSRAKKGLALVAVGVAVALVVILWPTKSSGTSQDNKPRATPTASATADSETTRYFKGLSKAIQNGNLTAQSVYVADQVRADFVAGGVLMFPRGTSIVFQPDTLVAETATTGHIKAVSNTTHYVVLLIKEKDGRGKLVWHISDTEEVKGQ